MAWPFYLLLLSIYIINPYWEYPCFINEMCLILDDNFLTMMLIPASKKALTPGG